MLINNYYLKYAAKPDIKSKPSYGDQLTGSLVGGFLGQAAGALPLTLAGALSRKLSRKAYPKDKTLSTAKDVDKLRKNMNVGKRLKINHTTPVQGLGGAYFHPGSKLGKINVELDMSGLKLEGIKIDRHVYVPKGAHPAVMAHELGHASGIGRSRTYNRMVLARKPLAALGGVSALLSPADSIGEKAGIGVVAAETAFTLGEEARASIKGLKGMKKAGIKAKGSKALLAGAIGTYALGAAATGIGTYGVYKGKRNMDKLRSLQSWS